MTTSPAELKDITVIHNVFADDAVDVLEIELVRERFVERSYVGYEIVAISHRSESDSLVSRGTIPADQPTRKISLTRDMAKNIAAKEYFFQLRASEPLSVEYACIKRGDQHATETYVDVHMD